MISDLARAEQELDSFVSAARTDALHRLKRAADLGLVALPEPQPRVNLHCHTFFSYNAFGYSPTSIAWLACKAGLAAAGIVDFDVLDGVEEFLAAGRLLGLRACAGIETRVFFPEFADKVMNSPGEPGICYHMGVGMPRGSVPPGWRRFLGRLRETSAERNRGLVARVNDHLDPVRLDYERDVLPLTPAGNATERHICLAYARAARALFTDGQALADYWRAKLGDQAGEVKLPESIGLQLLIRAKTMKLGGVGYVPPDSGSFPLIEETNRFLIAAGGIPAYAWFDGLSEGEFELEPLLRQAMATGVAALNVIPDRNYTHGDPDIKLAKLYQAVELAEHLGLPVVAGTEMNSPEHKFVDDFGAPEMKPVARVFIEGAHIFYAHSVLQREAAMGYLSAWAKDHLPDLQNRNAFFRELGHRLDPQATLAPQATLDPQATLAPQRQSMLAGVDDKMTPSAVLQRVTG